MHVQRREFMQQDIRGMHVILRDVIFCAVQKFRETGCLKHNYEGPGPPIRCHIQHDEEILATIFNNPRTSVHCIAHDLSISRYAVNQVLHMNELHPYHFQRMQQQLPGDEQRIYFYEGIVIIGFYIYSIFNGTFIYNNRQ